MEYTDEQIRDIIRRNLRKYREQMGVTQLELAQNVGSTPTTVASWEQGKSLPSPQMFYRLSLYFRVSMDAIYGLEGGNEE